MGLLARLRPDLLPAVRGAVDPGNGSHGSSSSEAAVARFPRPAGKPLWLQRRDDGLLRARIDQSGSAA